MIPGVAITGLSLFTPFGVGAGVLEDALRDGRVGVEPANDLPEALVGKIRDFDPQRYANVRGMRVYPRATQLEICAAFVALADAGLEGVALDARELGVVTASSFSHLPTLLEYDRGLTTQGMQRTNPTLMPLGLPSAPGAATALSLSAKAFSITLNDGGASGLAALGLAARVLAAGRARVCVVAGAFSLFPEFLLSASRAGWLASSERYFVLDRAGSGIALGEAAAALVLESTEHATRRGRVPLGFVRAEASRFAAKPSDLGKSLGRATRAALRRAELGPERLALACVGASGASADDEAHAQALVSLLREHGTRVPLLAPKANLGESLDPSGLVQAIAALSTLRARVAPPIARLEHPRVPGLCYPSRPTELGAGAALLTATSLSGSCSALVLSLDAE